MASFSLPTINDNPGGGWGPSSTNLPEQFKFKDIPYAPYSKSDKLGRFADWNDLSTDNRQGGQSSAQNNRGGGPGGRRRDGNQAFGSGTASAFAYFHVEDESSFSLVDNKTAPPRRGGGFSRGRGPVRGGYGGRGAQRGGRGGPGGRGYGGARGGARRGGWRDWEKVCIKKARASFSPTINHPRITAHASPLSLYPLSGVCSKRSNSIDLPNSDSKSMSLKICEHHFLVVKFP